MKPSFGSAYLDDNKTLIEHNTLHAFHVIKWGYGVGHYLKIFIINIRASKNISGLVNVTVTSPAGLLIFFLNVEPCSKKTMIILDNFSKFQFYRNKLSFYWIKMH